MEEVPCVQGVGAVAAEVTKIDPHQDRGEQPEP